MKRGRYWGGLDEFSSVCCSVAAQKLEFAPKPRSFVRSLALVGSQQAKQIVLREDDDDDDEEGEEMEFEGSAS